MRPSTVWSLAFITNIQYVVFLTDFPLGNATTLPGYILKNAYIKSMYYNKYTGKPHSDNFCFFRSVKHHRGNIKKVKEYVDIWKKKKNISNEISFPGVKMDDISELEICFNVKIMVYCLNSNGTVSLIYNSLSDNNDIMYLNLYDNHFNYITNFEKLVKRFQCDKCLKLFKRQSNLKRHYANCYDRTRYSFPGGFYSIRFIPPFFWTCDVPMNVIGEHMTDFCNNNDIIFKNRKLLISGTKAKKILLATPLLKWYLNHNCHITRIYQVIEFQPKKFFTSFIETVTENRLLGDRHKDKTIIGDTYKLLSNSAYGSVYINKTKHCNIKYLDNKEKAVKMINSSNFKNLDIITNSVYEVEMYKNQIKMDNPIQIGFFILQYAKLRMLEFYYDCLEKYLKPNSFELTETDTDSIYMALNEVTLDKCVKEEYYETYYKQIYNRCNEHDQALWFPRKCCDSHIALDKRYTRIFKEEFLGDKMISLCSKSYIIQKKKGKQKISCKGISKKKFIRPYVKI